ncbi:DUF4198 domain-containing protein [Nonomuraea basaltis]|uniref:DUF4198 domain-containing protein n=1 Tax=Nonomuraea basaltis TaxID=2495887 RepID=UPI00110C62A7|nr:DUF4198 domain-containing protein [Nonomuraea basaltis]TMR92062.1 DUF4198 domain-containing protein [Nonomuraea basaltis]
MLQRIRVAALAVMLGAGALVALTPSAATAAPPTPDISPVSISPSPPIDVTGGPVTATFTFYTKNADTAKFQLKPPLGVYSSIDLTKTSGNVWTKWTGTKKFEASPAGTWSWLATATGTGGAEASDTGGFEVVVKKQLDTKIVDFAARPGLVDKGDLIKVSGRLLADGKGYAGQTVAITFRERGTDAYREVTKVTTGSGGWFGATVRADATGYWRAEFAATAAAKGSVSDSDRVDVKRRNLDSKIVGFDARPEPVDKGDTLSFTGALRVEGRDGVAGERVGIFFKADGSHKWEYVTSDVTGRHGRFWASATAVTSGWWRAQYAGARGVNGSVSDADWVKVNQPAPPPEVEKADTRLIKFNAYPEPIKRGRYLKFKGKLQVDDEGSWEGYSGKVALFFKPLGSKKWQYVKSFWSSDSGRLYTKVKAWNSGHWRFVYGGDEDTYGDTSRKDYVRVKR